jgi:hypothetical protein
MPASLVQSFQQELRTSLGLHCGSLPDDGEIQALFDKWVPPDLITCRAPAECSSQETCRRRCSARYWRKHCEVVGNLMKDFAKALGLDERLFYVTGAVHDLDYVIAPHDHPDAVLARSHPIPIARELIAMDFPPLVSLAVLEHAPHLQLEPSSQLTHALIACGDAVTFAAANMEICWPNDLPCTLVEILNTAPRNNLCDPTISLNRSQRIFAALRAISVGTEVDLRV